MKKIYLFLLCLPFMLSAHSIVFIHIGPSLPRHLLFSVAQARLFNPECPIYVVGNQEALARDLESYGPYSVTPVACESLAPSDRHRQFKNCPDQYMVCDGYWVYTTERFYYLDDLIREYQLTDTFHLENDIMLYADLEDFLPVFHKYYKGMIGATFETDERCVAGLFYVAESNALSQLMEVFPICVRPEDSEMRTIAHFKDRYLQTFIDYLPVLPPEYIERNREYYSRKSREIDLYANHFEDFGSLFDAAAFGIYLSGWDPYFHAGNEESSPGHVSLFAIYKSSDFIVDWMVDAKGRRVPYIEYDGNRLRLNNLHVNNKLRLPSFYSLDHL